MSGSDTLNNIYMTRTWVGKENEKELLKSLEALDEHLYTIESFLCPIVADVLDIKMYEEVSNADTTTNQFSLMTQASRKALVWTESSWDRVVNRTVSWITHAEVQLWDTGKAYADQRIGVYRHPFQSLWSNISLEAACFAEGYFVVGAVY